MLALMLPAAMADFPACMPSMTCIKLTPYKDSDLVFDCATLNSSTPSNKSIYFMHGNDGPRAKGMMMESFAARGYNTLACDQRGFSPGASPNVSRAYNYDYPSALN
jgi:hypothetical protein